MASQKREEEEIGEVMAAINSILIIRLMVRLSKGAIAAAMVITEMQVEEEEVK